MDTYNYTNGAPLLGDERPADRRNLLASGTSVEKINLTSATNDVTLGTAGLADLGAVSKDARGVYRVSYQGTTSGDGLGAWNYSDFVIYENTAGVYLTAAQAIDSSEAGSATGDADDADLRASVDTTVFGAATLNGSGPDSKATVFVATATNVTHAAAWGAGKVLKAGNVYILDALSAASRTWKIERIG